MVLLSPSRNQVEDDDIIVDLKECENILKDIYNISKNDSLYIMKLIVKEIGMNS